MHEIYYKFTNETKRTEPLTRAEEEWKKDWREEKKKWTERINTKDTHQKLKLKKWTELWKKEQNTKMKCEGRKKQQQ